MTTQNNFFSEWTSKVWLLYRSYNSLQLQFITTSNLTSLRHEMEKISDLLTLVQRQVAGQRHHHTTVVVVADTVAASSWDPGSGRWEEPERNHQRRAGWWDPHEQGAREERALKWFPSTWTWTCSWGAGRSSRGRKTPGACKRRSPVVAVVVPERAELHLQLWKTKSTFH